MFTQPCLQNPNTLKKMVLTKCLKNMLAEKNELQSEINRLVNPPPRRNTQNTDRYHDIFVPCTIVVFAAIAVVLNLQDGMNTKKKNGKFIGYDLNHNGIVNEPGEQEGGEWMHTLAGLSIIVFVAAIGLLMIIPTGREKAERIERERAEKERAARAVKTAYYKKLNDEIAQILDKLEQRFNALSIDSQETLIKNNLADNDPGQGAVLRFIDPITMGIMRRPVEVWVKEPNGELRQTPTLFDFDSFKREATRQHNLRKKTLFCPKTTLPIVKVDFSETLNKEYQNYIINLHEAVETLQKKEENLTHACVPT